MDGKCSTNQNKANLDSWQDIEGFRYSQKPRKVSFKCDRQGAIISYYDARDVLCNNAGVMALPDYATKDGYDVQMQTNCISHFLLTKGWAGFPKTLTPEDFLFNPANIRVNWEGCEKAVGAFLSEGPID